METPVEKIIQDNKEGNTLLHWFVGRWWLSWFLAFFLPLITFMNKGVSKCPKWLSDLITLFLWALAIGGIAITGMYVNSLESFQWSDIWRLDKEVWFRIEASVLTTVSFLLFLVLKQAIDDVDVKNKYEATPLFYAVHGCVAQALIKARADIHALDKDSSTPLHYVTFQGHKAVVALLLEHGADVDAQTKNGMTPLHYAAWFGNEKMVKTLLKAGADVNVKDNDGFLPIYFSTLENHTAIIVALIEAETADIHKPCEDGSTMLHHYSCGPVDVVEALIKTGADVNAQDNEKKHTAPLGRCSAWYG